MEPQDFAKNVAPQKKKSSYTVTKKNIWNKNLEFFPLLVTLLFWDQWLDVSGFFIGNSMVNNLPLFVSAIVKAWFHPYQCYLEEAKPSILSLILLTNVKIDM